MKTNIFIKEVEELGLKTNKSFDSVRNVIFITKPKDEYGRGGRVAVVSVNNEFESSTRWNSYSLLPIEMKAQLYELIKTYIETPMNQR